MHSSLGMSTDPENYNLSQENPPISSGCLTQDE